MVIPEEDFYNYLRRHLKKWEGHYSSIMLKYSINYFKDSKKLYDFYPKNGCFWDDVTEDEDLTVVFTIQLAYVKDDDAFTFSRADGTIFEITATQIMEKFDAVVEELGYDASNLYTIDEYEDSEDANSENLRIDEVFITIIRDFIIKNIDRYYTKVKSDDYELRELY